MLKVLPAFLSILCLSQGGTPAGAAGDRWIFEDVSGLLDGPESTDPLTAPRHDYGPLWGDLDGDGWTDLIFMNHGDFPSLYLNQEGITFHDHFAGSGLRKDDWRYPQHRDRHGAACADFDNDGDLDLFITHGAKRGDTLGVKYDELLANQGDGTFVEISHQAGALNRQGRSRTPIWFDYNGDGWLDLLIGNFVSANVLLENRGDGTFSDVSAETGMAEEGAAHPSWADQDGDGDPDLMSLWPVSIHRNEGSGSLVKVPFSKSPGYPFVPSPVATAWGDFNNDGAIDVFVASRLPGRSSLFSNRFGRFQRVPIDLDLGPEEGGAGAAWGDLDNDGDLDLIVLGTERVRLLENLGASAFVARPLSAAPLRPGVDGDVDITDFDRDGRLDLAISAEDGQHLFRNSGHAGRWTTLSLRGTTSNAGGLGATVSLHLAGAPIATRQQLGDSGFHKSVGCSPLHLGLGEQDTIELRTRWPSGRRMRISGVPAGHHLVLLESRR